jgi:hypothetical protein
VLSIKKRDNCVVSVPIRGLSLSEWSADYGLPICCCTVSATAMMLASQMRHPPRAGGIVIECFEVWVLNGSEVVIGWREI